MAWETRRGQRYSPVVNVQAGGQVSIGALQAQSVAVAARVDVGEGGAGKSAVP